MNIYIVRKVPDQITAEDLRREFAGLGTVEHVTIKPPPSNPFSRMAIIRMAEPRGKKAEIPVHHGRERRERHLYLVMPRSKEERKDENEILLPEEKGKGLAMRALEHFIRLLKGTPQTEASRLQSTSLTNP